MYCTKCGKEIADNARFCPYCGEKIEVQQNAASRVSSEKPKTDEKQSDSENTTGFHKEYRFKSQAKGKGVDVGPITLIEGYSTGTGILLDDDELSFFQSRFLKKAKRDKVRIADIKAVESGVFFPLWALLSIAIVIGVLTFSPILLGSSPTTRILIVVVLLVSLLPEVKNIRATIIRAAGKPLFFDSRDKDSVELFKNDIQSHPKFSGKIGKNRYLVQKLLILVILVCSVVMIVNPDPFARFQLFEGTYEEWEAANFPNSCRTYIVADVTIGSDDTENDSILVYAGEEFDKEIWITNNKGQKIRDWSWLHDAIPVEENIAIFEITLTKFTNNDVRGKGNYFVYTDPITISYNDYLARVGGIFDSGEFDSDENAIDTNPEDNKEVNTNLNNDSVSMPSSSDGDFSDYIDWCGYYEGGWLDTGLWFGLNSDGTQNPECGSIRLDFRGNEFLGELYYRGGNEFYSEVNYASSVEKYYLYPNVNSGSYTIDIYTSEGDFECTYTMLMSYDEYVENEWGYDESEYIVDGSDRGYFEKSYFENLSDNELRLARNEILARHGRTFKDQTLQDYFNSKSWYTPIYTPEEFDAQMEQILNEWEKANIEIIKEVEASRK